MKKNMTFENPKKNHNWQPLEKLGCSLFMFHVRGMSTFTAS
jgi:hypothetical protein